MHSSRMHGRLFADRILLYPMCVCVAGGGCEYPSPEVICPGGVPTPYILNSPLDIPNQCIA